MPWDIVLAHYERALAFLCALSVLSFDSVAAEVGYSYEDLLSDATHGGRGEGSLAPPSYQHLAAAAQHPSLRSPGTFENVPLHSRGGKRDAARVRPASMGAYKLKVFTADRLNAGLGSTTVSVSLGAAGSSWGVHFYLFAFLSFCLLVCLFVCSLRAG